MAGCVHALPGAQEQLLIKLPEVFHYENCFSVAYKIYTSLYVHIKPWGGDLYLSEAQTALLDKAAYVESPNASDETFILLLQQVLD